MKKVVDEVKEADGKSQVITKAIQALEKQFGKGVVMKMSEKPNMEIGFIPTGSLNLDIALGIGGLPRGRVIEIYGPESSGKTTLTLHIIAEAQKLGGTCAFIDAEHAFDSVYAENLGVDMNKLYISQPDYGEQALEIADQLTGSCAFDVIVIDSVAALVPKAELEGDMGDSRMGLHARLMSQALRKITANISKANCVLIFINQLRDKIGVVFGNPETTTGGNALKYYASVRLDIRRKEQIKSDDGVTGNRTVVKVVKNKVAPPFKTASFDIIYGKGISRIGEIFEIAIRESIIQKAGSWYSYDGTKLGQGEDNAKQTLLDNEELLKIIERKVIDIVTEDTRSSSSSPIGDTIDEDDDDI